MGKCEVNNACKLTSGRLKSDRFTDGQVVSNFVSYYDAVSDLFMNLGRLCPRFAEYQILYPNSTRLQKSLSNFHASIVNCCKHVVEAARRPCKIDAHVLGLIIPDWKKGQRSSLKLSGSHLSRNSSLMWTRYKDSVKMFEMSWVWPRHRLIVKTKNSRTLKEKRQLVVDGS